MTSLSIAYNGMPSVAGWFKKLRKAHAERQAIRSTIKELSKLTDAELWDIGLSRGDIHAVAHGDDTLERSRKRENENLKGWV